MAAGFGSECQELNYINDDAGKIDFPSVVVPTGSQIFDDVTAKIPPFMLESLHDTEHLPFLLKLAENLTVNILMGMDVEQQDIQTYSYQGNLQSILEIQKRIHNHIGISDKTVASIGVGTNQVKFQSKGVMCTLVENPKFTKSGRYVKKKESLSYLYDDDSDTSFIISSKKGTKSKSTDAIPNNCKSKATGKQKQVNKQDLSNKKTDDDKQNKETQEENEVTKQNKEKQEEIEATLLENINSKEKETDDVEKTEVVENKDKEAVLIDNDGEAETEGKETEAEVKVEQEKDIKVQVKKEVREKMKYDMITLQDEETIEITEEMEEQIHSEGIGVYRKGASDDSLIGFILPRTGGKSELSLETIRGVMQKTKKKAERQRLQKIYYELKTPYRFKCNLCSFKSKRESHYKRHVTLHEKNNPKIYSCEICDYKTIRGSKMTAHVEQHAKEKDNEKKANGENTEGLLNKYICSICGTSTGTYKKTLLRHWLRVHGDSGEDDARTLFCTLCDYSTKMPNRLKRHMMCHQSMVNPDTYTNDFSCQLPGCNYKSTKRSLYLAHMRYQHEKQRFLCDLCGNSFKRKYCLQMHYKFVHPPKGTPIRTFFCEICGKSFRSLSHKKEHALTHTNKRSFLCETCGTAFKTKSSVKRHVATVHNDTKRYTCKYCHKKFATHYSRDRHENTIKGKCAPIDNVKCFQRKTSKIPDKVNPMPWEEKTTDEQKIETQILLQILPAIPTAVHHDELQHVTLAEQSTNNGFQDLNIETDTKLVKNETENFGTLTDTQSNISANQVVVLGNGLNTNLTTDSVVIGTVPVVVETVETQPAQVLSGNGGVIWNMQV